mgnify:CR=1 FL=1
MSRRLLLGYLSLTLFVLAVLEVPLAIAFARNEQQALTARVERDATALASFAHARLTGRAVADGTLDVSIGGPATALALGESFSCALRNDGAVMCWGLNARGQLGDGTTITRSMPMPVVF